MLRPPDGAPDTPSCELIAADLDFQRAMAALADSPRLSRAHESLAAESQMMLDCHPLYQTEKHSAYHQQILDAIESRDPRVLDVVRDHLRPSARLMAAQTRRF